MTKLFMLFFLVAAIYSAPSFAQTGADPDVDDAISSTDASGTCKCVIVWLDAASARQKAKFAEGTTGSLNACKNACEKKPSAQQDKCQAIKDAHLTLKKAKAVFKNGTVIEKAPFTCPMP